VLQLRKDLEERKNQRGKKSGSKRKHAGGSEGEEEKAPCCAFGWKREYSNRIGKSQGGKRMAYPGRGELRWVRKGETKIGEGHEYKERFREQAVSRH